MKTLVVLLASLMLIGTMIFPMTALAGGDPVINKVSIDRKYEFIMGSIMVH